MASETWVVTKAKKSVKAAPETTYSGAVILLNDNGTAIPVAVLSYPANNPTCQAMLLTPLPGAEWLIPWETLTSTGDESVGDWCTRAAALGFVVAHSLDRVATSIASHTDALIDSVLDALIFDSENG